ncbi:MAG TPA: group III truncated hemoglobin [Cytophagales bacterium]|jgi:hemoglobin
MEEITERAHIGRLVGAFYAAVRADDLLGPVFNALIPAGHWPAHLARMTDFWECNLLFRPTFKGNPMQLHRQVDARYGYGTDARHYDRWVTLWCRTVDGLFTGEKAALAKGRAAKMGAQLLTKVLEAKPTAGSHTPAAG